MDQQIVVYSYNGIILDNVTELTMIIYNTVASQKYVEWKSQTKKAFLLSRLYEIPKQAKLMYKDRNQSNDCQWRTGVAGERAEITF